jgi:hypothetical protein
MATRRTTSDKRQRERDKQQKAAAKRARRQGQGGFDDPEPTVDVADDSSSTEQLIARMEALHADYDAGKVSFEDFEEQKSALLDRIAIRLAQ